MSVTAPTQSALIPVRNTQRGTTIFRDQPADVTIRWEGAGDPAGADWQYVPEHYVNHPQFSSMVRKGVLVLGSADQAAGAFAAQDATAPGAALAADAASAFVRPEVNDFLQTTCVGPGDRAGSVCPNAVAMRQSEMGKKPPLCHAHASMASQFVPTQQTGADGMDATVWVQVAMTAPQTEITQPPAPPTA